MISGDKQRLLTAFNGNLPADEAAIRELEVAAGIRLPSEYVAFLRQHDGGEGFVGHAYLILWRLKELVELNKAYEIETYVPGLFAFGSDGGGEAFAFDLRATPPAVVAVPFVGLDLSLARPIAADFDSFLLALSRMWSE